MHNGGVDWQHVLFGVVAMLGQYGSPQSSGTDAYIQADTATAGQSSNFAQGQHSSDCVSAENACAGHQRRFLPSKFMGCLTTCHLFHSSVLQLSPKKVEFMKMFYFRQLFVQSFGQNLGTGLRIHITINLQTGYKRSKLPRKTS